MACSSPADSLPPRDKAGAARTRRSLRPLPPLVTEPRPRGGAPVHARLASIERRPVECLRTAAGAATGPPSVPTGLHHQSGPGRTSTATRAGRSGTSPDSPTGDPLSHDDPLGGWLAAPAHWSAPWQHDDGHPADHSKEQLQACSRPHVARSAPGDGAWEGSAQRATRRPRHTAGDLPAPRPGGGRAPTVPERSCLT